MACPVIYDAHTKIWSNPFKVIPQKMCLGQRIMKKLDQNDPNKIIEVNYDNNEKLTSGQLKTLVITAAQNLLKLGIKKGDIVLFFNEFNSLTTPIVFACYIIGAAICPLELKFGDDDADYIISKLNPTVILYDPIFKNRVESIVKRITLLNLKYLLSFEPTNDGQSVPQMLCLPIKMADFETPDLGDPDKVIAGLILTSGSTGRPKLICLSHSQIYYDLNSVWPKDSDSSTNKIIYIPTSFRWIGPVLFMLSPIFDDFSRVFSGQIPTPELCLDIIRKYKPTHFFAVDALLTQIFKYAEEQQLVENLKSLRYLLTGGERMSKLTNDLVITLTPNTTFIRGYGMTEVAGLVASTADSLNDSDCGIGYIVEGFSLKIIDQDKEPLGPNQNGQICIKRLAPHLKYYNDDKRNSESYTNDGEWYLTGDYGKFDDDNCLYVFNRCIDLIKCGQNIVIPSVLEKQLERHIAVESNYVIGVADKTEGEIPVAFIKLKSNVLNDFKSHEELKDDIKNYMKSVLPRDQLIPEKMYFTEIFPYTTSGKINKLALKQLAKQNFMN